MLKSSVALMPGCGRAYSASRVSKEVYVQRQRWSRGEVRVVVIWRALAMSGAGAWLVSRITGARAGEKMLGVKRVGGYE